MNKLFFLPLMCCSLLQAETIPDLSTLSLEELLNIQVTGVSRRSEQQNFAPGVVTVVSSQEFHQYGARHLRDVLDRIVGMQILSSRQWGQTKASIRGMNSAHNEGSVLVLLNGRPMREATDGGVNFDIYLGFPLETVDRIEVIRGPGSVMYGTNATAGVINIITKDAETSINENRIDIGAGSYNRRQLQLSSLYGNEDYSLNIGLNSIRAGGDTFSNITDRDGNIGDYIMDEQSDNLLVNGRYENFTMSAMVMNNRPSRANSAFQLPSTQVDKRRYFLDLGYLAELASGWDASLNYTLSTSSVGWQANESLGRNHYKDRSEMVESIVRGTITDDLNLLMGANFVRNSTAFDFYLDPVEIYNLSAYAQLDYMLTPTQKLIAGIQWNKPETTSSDLSARAGYIHQFGENVWLKLLYSEAYRSPNLVESYIRSGSNLWGNPDLLPEQVKTYDMQWIYQTPKEYFALTLYDTMHKDLIVRTGSTPPSHKNQGFVRYQGIEIEGRIEASQSIDLTANFAYQTNKTNNGVEDSTFAPNTMAKIGAVYKGIYGLTVSGFNSYIGKSTDLTVTNAAPARNPNADAYNLLTANLILDTGKLWGLGKADQSLISLYLDNLLDEKVYSPDLNFGGQNNTVPHHWGRNANLTYTYRF